MPEKTLGESRIRTQFNPSQNDQVSQVKQQFAQLIDTVNSIEQKSGEHARLKSIAMTEIEQAAMWAVKAVTY